MSNKLDILTLKLLEKSECSPTIASRYESADGNLLFFKSLLPSMRAMSKRKNRQARQKIQDVIFQLELSDEDYKNALDINNSSSYLYFIDMIMCKSSCCKCIVTINDILLNLTEPTNR